MKNKYMLIAVWLSLALCLIWFLLYGRKKRSTLKAVLIAVLVAAGTAGRAVFAVIPAFKPVTAIVIAAGAGLGAEAGFMTGALTAALSDMFFGQGPWTPFQMAVWGIIGIISGIFGKYIQKSRIFMLAFGALSGVLYSILMDIYTLFASGDDISIGRYIFYVGAGLPTTAVYAVSNVVFLAVLGSFTVRKLLRIKHKYFV